MTKPFIVTLSGKARSGKTFTANLLKKTLIERGYTAAVINYADYLKFVCSTYYNWNGEKDEKGRTLLQSVGTQAREVNENFWVDKVVSLVDTFFYNYDFIILGDCRFQNEIFRWGSYGYDALPINIVRPGYNNDLTDTQKLHESETSLDDFTFTYDIEATDLTELSFKVIWLADTIIDEGDV